MAKSKIKIKEIKKKIKVKEISEEGEVISDDEDNSFRPSSRSGRSASSSPVLETGEIAQDQEFEQAPARAEEERTSAVRYEPIVSRATEESEELSRRYSASAQQRSTEGERTAPILRPQGIAPQRTEGLFERRGISANNETREEKYELKKEPAASGKKRKYPWEM